MNVRALLSFLFVFALASPSAHASPLNPLTDGFTISIDGTALTNLNTSYNGLNGNLTFSNSTNTFTFAEIAASPLVSALSLTRVCVTLNLGGCASSTVSISNANVLNGTLQAKSLVGVTLQATANANVSNLVFASTTAALGAQTALVGYPDATAGATPEPGTVTLVLTGVLGAAGLARRRQLRA